MIMLHAEIQTTVTVGNYNGGTVPPTLSYKEVCRHLLYFVHGKNDSWKRHVPYISIENLLKIKLIVVYRLPHACLFSNFPSVIHVSTL